MARRGMGLGNTLDLARLARAVSRPGIDPRYWVAYATLLSEPYIETRDGLQDIFVDVLIHPNEQIDTARVGAIYAGNGFGFYAPLHEGDEVVVVVPSGDADECMVVIQRMWSPSDPPPTELSANPQDVTLVVEPEKNLRITVKGGGNVVLAVDTGKIYLGAEEGTEPAAKGQTLKDYLTSIKGAFDGHIHGTTTAGAPTTTPITAAVPPVPVTFPSPTDALLSTTTEVK